MRPVRTGRARGAPSREKSYDCERPTASRSCELEFQRTAATGSHRSVADRTLRTTKTLRPPRRWRPRRSARATSTGGLPTDHPWPNLPPLYSRGKLSEFLHKALYIKDFRVYDVICARVQAFAFRQ